MENQALFFSEKKKNGSAIRIHAVENMIFFKMCRSYTMGGTSISGKGVHVNNSVGVHFADFISFVSNLP